MYIHILVLFIILFITFCIVWKNELIKSLFYTVWFIITLWLNIPCFINQPILESNNNLVMFPYKLSAEWGIFYTIFANVILSIILFLQARFSNDAVHTYKEIKRIYDNFGNDAIELYIIGKNLDFLYKEEFKKQTDRIIHLGNKCKLLCEPTKNKDLLELYSKISAQGVETRFYTESDNITNLKGQIKQDQNGNKKAIFTSRINKKYFLLRIENQFLVSTILDRCIEVYKKSTVSEG